MSTLETLATVIPAYFGLFLTLWRVITLQKAENKRKKWSEGLDNKVKDFMNSGQNRIINVESALNSVKTDFKDLDIDSYTKIMKRFVDVESEIHILKERTIACETTVTKFQNKWAGNISALKRQLKKEEEVLEEEDEEMPLPPLQQGQMPQNLNLTRQEVLKKWG